LARGAAVATPAPRLINRPRPLPLESLDSLLQRTRWANHYTEPGWLRALLPLPPPPAELNRLREVAHYRALSALTGLDSATLLGLTLHRVASRYRDPAPWPPLAKDNVNPAASPLLWGSGVDARVRGVTTVCPRCWRDRRAVLLPWSLIHVTTCRRHRALLLDRCTRCGAELRLDVREDACQRCGRTIGTMRAPPIAAHPDSMALTEAIWGATGCGGDAFPPASLDLAADHPLRRVGTPSLLWSLRAYAEEVLVRARDAPLFAPEALLPRVPLRVREYWRQPPRLEELDLPTRHHGLVAAWRLLRDWDALWSAASHLTAAMTASRSGAGAPYPVSLETGSQGPRWSLAEIAWLQRMWGHTAGGYPWGRADLAAAPAAPSYGWMRHWDGQDLMLTLDEAAAYAQLGADAFVDLVAGGILPATYRVLPHDPTTWRFTERSLYHALRALLGHLPVHTFRDLPRPAVDLCWVYGYAERMGLGLATVLRGVGDGTLRAARTHATVHLVDLWFERTTAMAYLEERQRPARSVSPTSVWEQFRRLTPDSLYHPGNVSC